MEMQGQIRDGAKTRRDLRSGPIANKGEEARVVETKQNTDAVAGRGTGQQSGAPNLAQQQQWLGALIALTQGNPMLGPMGNNVASSSLSQHTVGYAQGMVCDMPKKPRENQPREWNGRMDTEGAEVRMTQKEDQDRGGMVYRAGQETNRPGSSGGAKMMCNKCKDTRHATKDCKLGHCAICGKKNHVT